MKSLSVNTLLKSVIGLMTVAILVLLAFGAVRSWNAVSAQARIQSVAGASDKMFTALHNLRVDRAETLNAMAAEAPSTVPRPTMTNTRAAEMPAIRGAIEILKSIDFPGAAATIGTMQRLHDSLTALQAESLAAVARPKAERRAAISSEYERDATAMIELLSKTSSELNQLVRLDDAFVDKLFDLKQLAWATRGAAGDSALMISVGLNGRPLPPEPLTRYAVAHGKAEAAWAAVKEQALGLPLSSAFRDAVAKADTTYFDKTYQEGQMKLLKTMAAGEKPA